MVSYVCLIPLFAGKAAGRGALKRPDLLQISIRLLDSRYDGLVSFRSVAMMCYKSHELTRLADTTYAYWLVFQNMHSISYICSAAQ
jgi:hypothetical protein